MEFRRLHPNEAQAAAAFAIEGMRPGLYPDLILSHYKINAVIKHFMDSTTDFHLAAFDGDRIVGGIAAAAYESPWFERYEATVLLCRAVAPGVGARLLSALREWCDESLMIRRAFFPMEFDASPAMARLLRRYGFATTQTVCTYTKEIQPWLQPSQ